MSRTIAKCCGAFRIEPRTASFLVTWANALLPLPLNESSTIGSPVVGSKSCRVPERFSSVPVMFGNLPFVAYWLSG